MKVKRLAIGVLSSFIIFGSLSASYSNQNPFSLAKVSLRAAEAKQSIYFVMTDRFENGNPANDNAGLADLQFVSGFEPSEPGYFHGGDLVGLTSRLPYIKSLGFTSIWITPPVKQRYVQDGSAAYHGYWGLDFTTIDPHLGTEKDFQNFINSAHALGLKVIIDIVTNHTADVIQYDAKGKGYIPLGNENLKKPAWLNLLSNYHNLGPMGDMIKGDFYSLDDLATEKPAVLKGWTDLWSSWITKFHFDGFRVDTARHVNPEFWQSFLPNIMKVAKSAGIPNFTIFGEVADSDPENTAPFVTEQKFASVLDFPFQSTITQYSKSFNGAPAIAEMFNNDDLYTTATTNAYSLTTFLGNHDMGRVGYILNRAAGWDGPEVLLERAKLSNAMLFFLRGSPALYYGDEKGMVGGGGDQLARQDMFPTQVDLWKSELRIGSDPIGALSSFDISNPLQEQVAALNEVRKNYPGLVQGAQQVRYAKGNIFAVSKYSGGQEYLVVFNSGDLGERADIPVSTKATTWVPIYGAADISGSDQTVRVSLPAHGYVALKAASLFVPHTPLSVQLTAPTSVTNSQGWLALNAAVPGIDFTNVTFLVRKKLGNWTSMGTADRRTYPTSSTKGDLYRVFLHPKNYKSGTKLEFMAVVRDALGNVVGSKIIPYTVKS